MCDKLGCKYFGTVHPPGQGNHVTICEELRCAKFGTYHVGESEHEIRL